MAKRTKVEVKGLEARWYDWLMNLITLGKYSDFIQQVIADLQLQPGEKVVDLGAGTGRNDVLMMPYLKENGKIYALEIGKEMQDQLRKKQGKYPQIELLDQRIEEPFSLPEKVDKAFISFVLHGFEQPERLKIIENVKQNLKSGGEFCILDYNHFAVDRASWYIRFFIRKLECELAEDFINHDWKEILTELGFTNLREHRYFGGYIHLLCAANPRE